MRQFVTILSLLSLFFVAAASADDKKQATEMKRNPAHSPEWTNSKDSDPGTSDSAIPELSGIVVLCATKPDSAEFKDQWATYVRKHYEPGMDIDAVIDDVLRQADAYRARHRNKSRSSAAKTIQPNAETRKNMHSTANAVIRKSDPAQLSISGKKADSDKARN
jgi:hypothetical protein